MQKAACSVVQIILDLIFYRLQIIDTSSRFCKNINTLGLQIPDFLDKRELEYRVTNKLWAVKSERILSAILGE